jgi:hypothetical protein
MAICLCILLASSSAVRDRSGEVFVVYVSCEGKNDVIRTLNKDNTVYPLHIHTPIMMTSTTIKIKSLQLPQRVAIYKLYEIIPHVHLLLTNY